MNQKKVRLIITISIIVAIFLTLFLVLKNSGIWDRIDSVEDLRDFIKSGGMYSYLIFFAVQFLQVSLLPIPAVITTLAGVLLFGGWTTFGISIVAVMLASALVFYMGRKLGKKVVVWIIGEEDTQKWSEYIGKYKYTFFLAMLFPLFPDDLMCMVAGITPMTWRFFLITNAITRPIGIFCTCFLGSGTIPFEGWGIVVWIVLIVAMLVLLVISFKYKDKIEQYVIRLSERMTNKEKK